MTLYLFKGYCRYGISAVRLFKRRLQKTLIKMQRQTKVKRTMQTN